MLSRCTLEQIDLFSSDIFFSLMLHSAVCLTVTFFSPSSRADGVSGVRWLDLGHTVYHLCRCPFSHHYLVLR